MTIENIKCLSEQCTGCGACRQKCKFNAVEMKYSEDGFLYPSIDYNKCMNCSACYKVCPLIKEKNEVQPIETYSGYALDFNIVNKSSSGGIFYYLAQSVLSDNGVVFGAVFDYKTKEIRHVSTDEMPLERLLRSKYVQSKIGNTFIKVEKELNEGRKVLFVGTPCQVRGLKEYIGTRCLADNLITVDFKCHGVPSVSFFKMFLHSLEEKYKSRIIDVSFREKDKGWYIQVLKVYFENGYVWKKESYSSYYYYYFLQNYSLRDSCYGCREYKSHVSDLTLADDWTSAQVKNPMGTSLIFVNTHKGKELLNLISKNFVLNLTVIKDNSVYSHEKYKKERKIEWLNALKKQGFEYVSKEFFKNKFVKLKRSNKIQRAIHSVKDAIKKSVKKLLKKRG